MAKNLRDKCYEMGNSKLPVDVFYNDIRDNKVSNFNKDEAYADLEKIVDYIEKLQSENEELKETIKQMQHNKKTDTELEEVIHDEYRYIYNEYTKLRYAIEILKRFEIDVYDCCDGHYFLKISYNTGGLTKEEYELLEEILKIGIKLC